MLLLVLSESLPEPFHFLIFLSVCVLVLLTKMLKGFYFLHELAFFLLVSLVCLFVHPVHFPNFYGEVVFIVLQVFLFPVKFVDATVESKDYVLGFFQIG